METEERERERKGKKGNERERKGKGDNWGEGLPDRYKKARGLFNTTQHQADLALVSHNPSNGLDLARQHKWLQLSWILHLTCQ